MMKLNRHFAKQLLEDEDYQRAADEYQRLIYCYSIQDSLSTALDSLRYSAGLSCRRLSQYDKSNSFLKLVTRQTPDTYFSAQLMQAANDYNQKLYEQSLDKLLSLNQLSEKADSLLQIKARHLLIANYLIKHDMAGAIDISTQLQAADSTRFGLLIDKAEHISRKSPLLAATMSTLIPGSGKIYTERSLDGIYSFMLILFSAWKSYNGYDHNGIKSPNFWIFGSMSTYFYLGNIYGSAVSAKLYNAKQKANLQSEIDAIIDQDN